MSTARQRRGYRGVNKLRRTLRRLEPAITQGIRKQIDMGAQAIEADMRINIAKDTYRTADLITSKLSRDGLTARIGLIGKKAVAGGYAARFLEYGTKGYPEGNVPPQLAQPFMTPAFDANKDWIFDGIQTEIAKVIVKLSAGDGTNE